MRSAFEVGKFMYWHPIPIHGLDEEKRGDVRRWLQFAYVPLKESCAERQLLEAQRLTDSKISRIIPLLGFTRNSKDGVYHRPGAEDVPENERVPDTHVFTDLQRIRVFLRGTDDENIRFRDLASAHSRSGRCRGNSSTAAVDATDMFALRVWAANSPEPLPCFVECANDDDTEDAAVSTPAKCADEPSVTEIQEEVVGNESSGASKGRLLVPTGSDGAREEDPSNNDEVDTSGCIISGRLFTQESPSNDYFFDAQDGSSTDHNHDDVNGTTTDNLGATVPSDIASTSASAFVFHQPLMTQEGELDGEMFDDDDDDEDE